MKRRGIPSREELLAFIASERAAGREIGRREVARAFGLGPGDRSFVKRLLIEIERAEHGQDEHGENEPAPAERKRRRRHEGVQPVMLLDVTGRDSDGELVAMPVEWDEDLHGAPPRVLLHPDKGRRRGAGAAGVGDRVLARIEAAEDDDGHATHLGRILKVLSHRRSAVIGVFRAQEGGGGRIVPVDKKALGKELFVPAADAKDAREGDLVAASVTRGTHGLPRGRIVDRLGSLASERAISLIAIHAHGIPWTFSQAALHDAEKARPATLAGREDWRELPLITIDPADAKDHDDAVHAAADEDPANPGGFVLNVAIADVAAYVRPGTALDREAQERGNSVYFPDRVVPMLPERISNDLCSLRPGEDRAALAVRIVIDAEGRKRRHGFHRVLMRSAAKLAYPDAQAAVDGRPSPATEPLLEPVLRPLWAAYGALRTAREARQPLDLDLPERKLTLDADGHVTGVTRPERLDAHRLIEEFMILANVCAVETLERAPTGLIYRVHDEPTVEKMRALGDVLASVGIKLPKSGALQPALFNRILAQVRGGPHEAFINEVVLRSQAQAEYSSANYGHFGLNLRRYAHFTSPIRRYADLIVHRALIGQLGLGGDGLPAGTSPSVLAEIATQISATERRAMVAERETTDRLIAQFLADRIGATFPARIGGVTRAGLFVRLEETGADGFIPASTLGAEYFMHDEANHALVGQRSGETFRLGDAVEVRLVEAQPVAGALRFEMVSEGSSGGPLPSRRGRFITRGRIARSAGKGQFRRGRAGSRS